LQNLGLSSTSYRKVDLQPVTDRWIFFKSQYSPEKTSNNGLNHYRLFLMKIVLIFLTEFKSSANELW